MPKKKKSKTKDNKDKDKKGKDEGSNMETSGEKTLSQAMILSISNLPKSLANKLISKYLAAVKGFADSYLSFAGIDSTTTPKAMEEQMKQSGQAIRNSARVTISGAEMLLKDEEIKESLGNLLQSIVKLSENYVKLLVEGLKEQIPVIEEQGEKYIETVKSVVNGVIKGGINAGLNALQGIPGIGQVVSLTRLVHSITMPMFVITEKFTDFAISTTDKVLNILKKLSIPGIEALDSTASVFIKAKDAQDTFKRKLLNMSESIQGNIPKVVRGGGHNTRKRALKKKHRRKSRRRMHYF